MSCFHCVCLCIITFLLLRWRRLCWKFAECFVLSHENEMHSFWAFCVLSSCISIDQAWQSSDYWLKLDCLRVCKSLQILLQWKPFEKSNLKIKATMVFKEGWSCVKGSFTLKYDGKGHGKKKTCLKVGMGYKVCTEFWLHRKLPTVGTQSIKWNGHVVTMLNHT